MLNVTVNGQIASSEPTGVTDLVERIYYSVELGGYLSEVTGSVSFYGDDYSYLKNLRNTLICESVSLVIYDSEIDVPIFNGKMFLTDMEWFPDQSRVDAEVLDDGYLSDIDGNREIEAVINVGKSKNGFVIPSLALSGLTFWNETRSLNYPNRSGMRVGDALDFLVDFMTDGAMNFVSDFFDTNTNAQYYDMICTGITMRDATATYPTISFDKLFTDLQRLYNLAFAVERTLSGLQLRIEPKSYFYKSSTGLSFDKVSNPRQSVNSGSFYASVDFGSAQTTTNYTYFPNIPFAGVLQEQYHLGGECNINTKLGLKLSKLITETNIIQDVLPSGTSNDNYDDDVFLVRFADLNNSHDAMTVNPVTPTFYYYNEPFSNFRVAERWFEQIPESIFSFLGSGNDQAFATQTLPNTNIHGLEYVLGDFLLKCNDDTNPPNEDPSNNYTYGAFSVTVPNYLSGGQGSAVISGDGGYYTAPINGVYNISVSFFITGQWFNPVGLVRTDASGLAIDSAVMNLYATNPPGFNSAFMTEYQFTQNFTFFMNVGEKVAFIVSVGGAFVYIRDATFSVLDPLGGQWQTNDSRNVRLIETAFDYDIAQQDWNEIRNDPFKTFSANFTSGSVNGWISEMERNRLTGRGSVRIQSKQ